MNQIFIPVSRVHLETVFERGERTQYALLEPEGEVSPLRVRFSDLHEKLLHWFAAELSAETIVERIEQMHDRQLVVVVTMDGGTHSPSAARWTARVRNKYPFEENSRRGGERELRRSPRRQPARPTDVKLELGTSSIEGTVYNISEHGLGIALLTTDLEHLNRLRLDQEVQVEVESSDEPAPQRVSGRIRSQYPADGGCVLGIELRQKLYLDGSTPIEA